MPRPRSTQDTRAADYIGTKEAASILGISVSSIQKMVNSGTLSAFRTSGGHRRILLDSLRKTAATMDIPWSDSILPKVGSRTGSAGSALKILVVEDNPVAAKAVLTALKKAGEQVSVAVCSDGAEALLRIAEEVPALVITDLAMQPFDGFRLIKVMRSSPRLANIGLLVVTGLSAKEIAERGGLDADITVYAKPVHAERLGGYIDALLSARMRGALSV
jgi:excisionase family DNA binding protein